MNQVLNLDLISVTTELFGRKVRSETAGTEELVRTPAGESFSFPRWIIAVAPSRHCIQ